LDKAIDPIINLMQLQPLVDPIPRPLWRPIIQDQFVDFEKLHTSMDWGFSHNDDVKDFAGGFSLVRKDQYSAMKVVRNEAEWAQVFQAWKTGVTILYPHRLNELNNYQDMVIELFHAAPYDLLLPSMLMLRPVTDTLAALIEWTTTVVFNSRFYHRCCESVKPLTLWASKRAAVPCQNWSLGICTDPCAFRHKHGICSECRGKHKARDHETCLSKAEAAILEGPKSFPHSTTTSPSALYTETAPPFHPPPIHLIDDPNIQSSLSAMKDSIKVNTPFNIDKFEALLKDHLNQPFVRSVMQGLQEGFWPFDEGDWKNKQNELSDNFAFLPEDLAAIRSFRDKELRADRWSSPLSISTLLPGMKISPMFVVWQHAKPRVVTDHSSSGLNNGIPRSEGHVLYDDMHSFGQALRNARAANPQQTLITFKSDVASAFLNLPAHPLATSSGC
jgi:hypothetical protein